MAPRRVHSKVDKLPEELQVAINDAIVNKRMTYKEILDMVHNTGHKDISKSSLERYGRKFLAKLERISTAREQAKAIIETSQGINTDMAEATSTVAFQLLMEMLINHEGDLDKTTISAIKALASLERSNVSREKLKFEFDKGVAAAKGRIEEELRKELQNYPEVVVKLGEILNKVETDLKAS